MAQANVALLDNKKGTYFTLYFGANGYALCSGNSTTSNVNGTSTCIAIGEEVMTGAIIDYMHWGVSNNQCFWTIARGGNTYFVEGNNDGEFDLAGHGIAFKNDASANVNVTLSGTGTGHLILKMKKISGINWVE